MVGVWVQWCPAWLMVWLMVRWTAGLETAAAEGSTPTLLMPTITEVMSSVGELPLDTLDDLDAYTTSLKHSAHLLITKAFTTQLKRQKRELLGLLQLQFKNVTDPNKNEDLKIFKFATSRARTMVTLEQEGILCVIMCSTLDGTQLVLKFKDGKPAGYDTLKISQPKSSAWIDSVAAEFHHGFLWLALGSSHAKLVAVFCFNPTTKEVGTPQHLPTAGPVSLCLSQHRDGLYLVIGEKYASSTKYSGKTTPTSAVYQLHVKYFDRVENMRPRSDGVQSLACFHHDGEFYLVFGMVAGRTEVYLVDLQRQILHLLQEVQDRNAHQVVQFVERPDNKRFLLTATTAQPLTLYFWMRKQVYLWQQLPTPPLRQTSRVVTLTVAPYMETVILLFHESLLLCYTEDSLGSYNLTHVTAVGCSEVSSLTVLPLDGYYVIAFLCKDPITSALTWKFVAMQFKLVVAGGGPVDPVEECLDELTVALEDRKTNITILAQALSSGSLLTGNHTKRVTGPLHFAGGLTVTGKTTFAQSLTIKVSQQNGVLQSHAQLSALTKDLQHNATVLLNASAGVLRFSGDQTIVGPVNTPSLTVDTASFNILRLNSINGIKLEDIMTTFLLHGIDQTFSTNVVADTMVVDKFTTGGVGTINGILTKDLMRKSVSGQVVSGEHLYSTVVATSISGPSQAPILINGINSSTIVTANSSVTFTALKTFKNLRVLGDINVGKVNNVDINDLESQVVYTDTREPQILEGTYHLGSVEVGGNVEVASIDGVNLRHLDSVVVKTTGNHTLRGGLRLTQDLNVKGSLFALTLNGVEWDKVVYRNYRGIITGNYTFGRAVVHDAIVCDDINGVDLSKDVVLVNTPQIILGHIHFLKSVVVTGPAGVLVDEAVTINNIDISSLAGSSSSPSANVLVVKDHAVFSVPLKCSGNVEAATLNGMTMDGIEHHYWRKSVHQEIHVKFHLDKAVFLGPVTAGSLNGHQMTEFLTYSTPQIITGSYTFTNLMVVDGDLGLGANVTVDGVNLVALSRDMITKFGNHTIHGEVRSQSKVTVGHLRLAGTINGINLWKDLMRLDQSIPHTGHLSFTSKVVVDRLVLGGELRVGRLNGLVLEEAVQELVLRDQDATIHTDLYLTGSDVKILSLEVKGSIDGINWEAFKKRALLKSSAEPQRVRGSLVVEGAVHFAGPLTLSKVNNLYWTQHLNNVVLKDYTGLISGTKTFLQPVYIQQHFNPATINGINIADLVKLCFTKSGNQTIYGHFTFTSSIAVGSLIAEVIDGVAMREVLYVDQPGKLLGTAVFKDLLIFKGDVQAASDILGGCDMKELSNQVIQRDSEGNWNVTSSIRVEHLTVTGAVLADRGVLVGPQRMDLDQFLNTLVLRSKEQEIFGNVKFLNTVRVARLELTTINGIHMSSLMSDSVMDNELMDIHCDLEFVQPLVVRRLVVRSHVRDRSGLGVVVNGVNITALAASALRVVPGQPLVVDGDMSFLHGLHARHLTVNQSINGIPVRDLVTVTPGVPITSPVTFQAPITVQGNLQVDGLLDGVDLAKVLAERVRLDRPAVIHGHCKFENLIIEGDLEVEAINGVLISDLVVRRGRAVQEISGFKNLSAGLMVRGLMEVTTINNVDIEQLKATVVRKDRSATINFPVVFENTVWAKNVTKTVDGVGGTDVHNISEKLTETSNKMEEEYRQIISLAEQIKIKTDQNYAVAQELFIMLCSVERRASYSLAAAGDLRYARTLHPEMELNFLSVRDCDRQCGCTSHTSFYFVNRTGHLETEPLNRPGAVFILFSDSHQLQITLIVTCHPELLTHVKVERLQGGSLDTVVAQSLPLGLLSDAGLFVDGGLLFIVTVSKFVDESYPSGTTMVSVLRYDPSSRSLVVAWQQQTPRSAASLSLAQINYQWYLLVANKMGIENNEVYTAVSVLYVWDREQQQFVAKRDYIGDHVTSGLFMTASHPMEEHFFTLAQLRSARYQEARKSLDYTKKVLVFKYMKETDNFEEFESLPTVGVVDQATFTIGHSLYLMLLSNVKERLDVYEYYPLEGFQLYQRVPVEKPLSVEVILVGGKQWVAVTSSSPARLTMFAVRTKGVDPSQLY